MIVITLDNLCNFVNRKWKCQGPEQGTTAQHRSIYHSYRMDRIYHAYPAGLMDGGALYQLLKDVLTRLVTNNVTLLRFLKYPS